MRWVDDIWHCGLTFICFAGPEAFLFCRGSDSVGATSEEVSATATWQREHIRSAWRKSIRSPWSRVPLISGRQRSVSVSVSLVTSSQCFAGRAGGCQACALRSSP
jgi:hypothetical protein